jgi:hypothetical protein
MDQWSHRRNVCHLVFDIVVAAHDILTWPPPNYVCSTARAGLAIFPPVRPVIRRSRAIGLVDPHGDVTTHGRVPFSIAARDRDGAGRQASRH